jgi:hypothetical protein
MLNTEMQQEIKSTNASAAMIAHIQIKNKDNSGSGGVGAADSVIQFWDSKNDKITAVTAALACAAPELLAALKIAREYVAASHGVLKHAMGPDNLVKPDLDLIDAAIAKAL